MRDGESNISILELRTLTVPGKSSQLKKIYIFQWAAQKTLEIMKTRQKSSNKKERKLLKLSEKAPEKSTEKHIKNIVLVRKTRSFKKPGGGGGALKKIIFASKKRLKIMKKNKTKNNQNFCP